MKAIYNHKSQILGRGTSTHELENMCISRVLNSFSWKKIEFIRRKIDVLLNNKREANLSLHIDIYN